MIGVSVFLPRDQDKGRAKPAQGVDDASGGCVEAFVGDGFVWRPRKQRTIGEFEIFAKGEAHNTGGFGSFFGACLGIAVGGEFSACEVEDAGVVAALSHLDHQSTTKEFNVIGMWADGE